MFSTVGAFYLPLTFIVAIYLNVYRVARSRIHRRQFDRRRDGDRPGARDASTIDPDVDDRSTRRRSIQIFRLSIQTSTIDPDIDTAMQPPSVVLRALRSRLSAISLGLPSSQPPASMPLNRVVSLNYGRTGSTANPTERSVSNQQQQLLQPPASHQFLSVNTSPRLSESNSSHTTPASSRGGSLIYFTRFVYFVEGLLIFVRPSIRPSDQNLIYMA